MSRLDGRSNEEMRKVLIEPNVAEYAEGSAMIHFGSTKVLCTASLEDRTPPWMEGSNKGWVTAEYNLLPRSTQQRTNRERGKVGGRTQEIQRLISRSLRSVVDLKKMPGKQIIIDCDVIQADAGTRTASISGGFVALSFAIDNLLKCGKLKQNPIMTEAAAVSVAIQKGFPILDPNYLEDSTAEVDFNVVATGRGELVEIQGTAENKVFTRGQLDKILDLAFEGITGIVEAQKEILGNIK